MPTLNSIQEIGEAQLELLEAAGWTAPRHLAIADPEVVVAELEKANRMLNLAKEVPGREEVEKWIGLAKGLVMVVSEEAEAQEEKGEPDRVEDHEAAVAESSKPTRWVNYEAEPEVREMLKRAPVAMPLPNRMLAENGIPPAEIPPAPVLNRAVGDLEVRVTAAIRKSFNGAPVREGARDPLKLRDETAARKAVGLTEAGEEPGEKLAGMESAPRKTPLGPNGGMVKMGGTAEGPRMGIDVSKVRSIEDAKGEEVTEAAPVAESEPPTPEEERLLLLRTTREETNRGKDPNSRGYIRGVLHDRPYKVWFGSLFLLLTYLLLPTAVVSAVLLILSDQLPERFPWVPKWLIVFPLLMPLFGILYFAVCFGVKCRVCGQKVLVPRHCRKNKKAHHVRGLGYVIPLALHVLTFRWFNCTFCGTSVRIKE